MARRCLGQTQPADDTASLCYLCSKLFHHYLDPFQYPKPMPQPTPVGRFH
jgi:hypothetical protein